MSYLERLSEMKYTSPSGKAFTLNFDELSRVGGKKVPVVEFPGQNQGAIQDLGEITITFPVTCYISGADYDAESDKFWEALSEPGKGTLDHPRWGRISVVPSTRRQAEDFIEGASRAVFTIEFIKADDKAFDYPKIGAAPELKLSGDVDAAATSITASVEDIEITDPGEKAALRKNALDSVSGFRDGMKKVSAQSSELSRDIQAQARKIEREIDSYILAPADLMTAMLDLYRLPGQIVTDVQTKIAGYVTAYTNLVNGFIGTTEQYGERLGLIAVGQSSAIVTAAAESSGTGAIATRGDAARSIQALAGLYDTVKTTIDDLGSIGQFQADYEAQKAVNVAVSLAINSLFERALNLPTEQVQIMEKSISPLEMVYELYGGIDRLDEFIEYNDFQGDEILIIPRGREVRWYA